MGSCLYIGLWKHYSATYAADPVLSYSPPGSVQLEKMSKITTGSPRRMTIGGEEDGNGAFLIDKGTAESQGKLEPITSSWYLHNMRGERGWPHQSSNQLYCPLDEQSVIEPLSFRRGKLTRVH